MTNYTIVGSRSTAMPITHPKLKRENKTDRSTKPCSNCGCLDGRAPTGPLAASVSDLISRITDGVLEEVPEVAEPTGSDADAIIAAARAGSTGGRQGEEVGFATDSPVEGDGFELSVPRERGYRFELSRLFMSLKPSAF